MTSLEKPIWRNPDGTPVLIELLSDEALYDSYKFAESRYEKYNNLHLKHFQRCEDIEDTLMTTNDKLNESLDYLDQKIENLELELKTLKGHRKAIADIHENRSSELKTEAKKSESLVNKFESNVKIFTQKLTELKKEMAARRLAIPEPLSEKYANRMKLVKDDQSNNVSASS